MRELLLEIWTSVRRNKLRTFLTGFSVAWGIFMLVILLGSGNGLKNGVLSNFGNYATNSITISGGWTSKAYAGYNKWRSIDLKNRDLEILVNEFPEVDDVAAKAWYRGSTATYLDRFADISLRGSLPKIQQIEGVEIVKGRFINQADIHNYRKVIVIDEALERILFRGDDPLGKPVKIHNNIYRVAGVYRGDAQQRNSMGYIPLTTGQLIFKANDPVVDNAIITVHGLDTVAQMEAFEQRIRKRLAVTDAEQSLRKEIEQAWYNADAAYGKYRSADAALTSARVAFAYEQQKADAGRSTVFDFNDAKTRMEKAESELVQAKYEFVFRSKILDFYRGRPLEL